MRHFLDVATPPEYAPEFLKPRIKAVPIDCGFVSPELRVMSPGIDSGKVITGRLLKTYVGIDLAEAGFGPAS